MSGSQYFVDKVQGFINLGSGIATRFLGKRFAHYRPMSTGPVISNINMIEQLNVTFDQDPSFSHREPKPPASQLYYGLFDLTNTQIGDYFVNECGDETFYVLNFEPLRPVSLMRCNRTVNVFRPEGNSGTSNGYGGDTTPVTLLTGWPVSILSGGIGGANVAGTPGSVKDHGVVISLPAYPGVIINTYDVLEDDIGRRYVVGENELSALGWRLLSTYESS